MARRRRSAADSLGDRIWGHRLFEAAADRWCRSECRRLVRLASSPRRVAGAQSRGGRASPRRLCASDPLDNAAHSPLDVAASVGCLSVVSLLLAKGANTKKSDPSGKTALFWAVAHGHEETVRSLLSVGAAVNVRDKDARTPIFWAMERGRDGILEALLTWGANIHWKDHKECTPAFWAAFSANEVAFRTLKAKGAKFAVRDGMGMTPLHWLSAGSVGAEGRDAHEITCAEFLKVEGVELSSKDKNGSTPLHVAAFKGKAQLVRWLIEKGADVLAKDIHGATPRESAAGQSSECSSALEEAEIRQALVQTDVAGVSSCKSSPAPSSSSAPLSLPPAASPSASQPRGEDSDALAAIAAELDSPGRNSASGPRPQSAGLSLLGDDVGSLTDTEEEERDDNNPEEERVPVVAASPKTRDIANMLLRRVRP